MINGAKNWITQCGIADFYVVFAVTDQCERRRIMAPVVESDRLGCRLAGWSTSWGSRASRRVRRSLRCSCSGCERGR
ncbi:MAG: hypothetical protein R2736_03425 [Solirubrobacterales bacterium]